MIKLPFHFFSSYKAFCSLFILFLSLNSILAQGNKKIPSEKPKLVVGIIIDQMRYDYIFRYWDKYGDDGFKRLVNEGTFCKNANFNYLFTQSAPGYATISTGTNPSNHGIIANEWYYLLKEKKINCTDDDKVKTVGGSYEEGRKSPVNLNSTTLGDELRLSNNFKSKVFAISMDNAPAILSAGHTANGAYWYDNESGNWITSSYYTDTLPKWVDGFNQKKFADTYLAHTWEPLLSLKDYTESLPDDNKYESGLDGKKTFPYLLGEMTKNRKQKAKYELLKSTPFGNNYTKDFAISCIIGEGLGKHDYTDLITISFSSTAYVGEKFGMTSIENEDMYLRLDQDIAHFLKFIDDEIGKENTLVFLTSDHGVAPVPQYLSDQKIPVGYFNNGGIISLLKSYLNIVYGKGEWVKYYNTQQIYLNRNLIEDSKNRLEDVQEKVSQFLMQSSGVANTITSTTIEKTNFTNGIYQKMQNSYNQKRSGDVFINLEAGWIENTKNSTSTNSAYTYDTHVPLLFYGWKVKRSTISRPVDMIDIAPTLATFLNISFPNACTGKPISEMGE
jgi:predicted AlkP superfamily pyrophosphatase or phosphodiesterase